MSNLAKIPITVLTGFLGSGKTTLLNYILTHNEGLKIGVVVNDFGSINIDAKLVAKKTDKMMELSNGCMCCSLDSLDLQEAIAQFVYPKSPIDYIIIEASGLAEPYDLLTTLRDNLTNEVKLDSIIGLIDAANIIENAQEYPTALKQVQFADFIVINKIDLIKKTQLTEIEHLIHAINNRARLFKTEKGQIDLHLILDQDVWKSKELPTQKNSKAHAHSHYQTFSFSSEKPLDPLKFQHFVNKSIPTSVYRAKGFVDLGPKGHNKKYIFQLVGARADIAWGEWESQKPKTEIIFIGQGVKQEQVLADLKDCIDDDPNTKTSDGHEVQLPKRAE